MSSLHNNHSRQVAKADSVASQARRELVVLVVTAEASTRSSKGIRKQGKGMIVVTGATIVELTMK